jgi:hypothetical protein
VQEAADEEANIIFGAVVDPALKGKVKITVIATGFGPLPAGRHAPSTAQTPTDMTPYTEHARVRLDVTSGAAAAANAGDRTPGRLSIARRPLLDLPLAASGNGASPAFGSTNAHAAHSGSTLPRSGAPASVLMRREGDPDASTVTEDLRVLDEPDPDADTAFDVPAFLRRQDG